MQCFVKLNNVELSGTKFQYFDFGNFITFNQFPTHFSRYHYQLLFLVENICFGGSKK